MPSTTDAGSDVEPRGWRRALEAAFQIPSAAAPEFLQWAYNLYAFAALWVMVQWHRPDFIYERYGLNSVAGVWVARSTGTPLLLEVNSPLADEETRLGKLCFPRVARALERQTMRAATKVLAVSTPLLHLLEANGDIAPGRAAVVPNGVVPTRFEAASRSRRAVRTELGVDDETTVVGAVAFFREWHGMERLIEWLRERRRGSRVALLLIGDGPALPGLKDAVAQTDAAQFVKFTGSVDHPAVPRLLAATDITVVPQAVPYASPLKLFEYLAAGKAVVAPAQANITEIVTDGVDALTFPPGDAAAMHRALNRLIEDPALRARLGQSARDTIVRRQLTWDAAAARIVEHFERLPREQDAVPDLLYL